METRLYLCHICKNKVPFVKYTKTGILVCPDCLAKQTPPQKKPKEEKPIEIKKSNERINLICADCRYKWSIGKNSRIPLSCPYCGKKRVLEDTIDIKKLI